MATLDQYRTRPHWSFSAMNQFLSICSLQFYFQRIAKCTPSFTSAALSFGSAFHRTMEFISHTRIAGSMPHERDVRDLFRDLWSRQLKEDKRILLDDGKKPDDYGAEGADQVAAYLAAVDPEEEVVGVNEAFAVPLIDAAGNVMEKPLIGELDCRIRSKGEVAIVDWKTAARRWPKGQADKSLQPTAYLYAERQLHGADVLMRFDVVVKNKTPVVEQHVTRRDIDSGHRMVELVKMAEKMIAAEHFLPNESSFYCAGCPFQGACKDWHRKAASVSVAMAA